MRRLHIIMPMAGEGSRFKEIGINTPKPVLKAKNKLFFIRALSSIQTDNIYVSCIVQKKHNIKNIIDENLKLPHKVLEIDNLTNGSAETCMLVSNDILDDDIIIILDCDLEFQCKKFKEYIEELRKTDTITGGALVSFESNKPIYSYAKTNKNNEVIETAEKIVISNNAICGAYLFNSGKEFKDAYSKVDYKNSKEKYISLLFNYVKGKIKLFKLDYYASFGTPLELEEFEKPKLIIVDFDGTLIDTYEANQKAYKKAFETIGVDIDYSKFYGKSFDYIKENLSLNEETSNKIKELKSIFYKSYFNKTILNIKLIDFIKTFDCPKIILTMASRKNVMNLLKYYNIENLFKEIITNEDITIKKPNITCFFDVINKYNSNNSTMIFEDDINTLENLEETNEYIVNIKNFNNDN